MSVAAKSAVLLSFTCLLSAGTAQGQQWSAQEQEVLDQVEECFASYTEASAQNDPQIWVRRCRPADESLFWTAGEAGPLSLQGLLRNWELSFPKSRQVSSTGFEPIRIRVVDDIALVYGYTYWFDDVLEGPSKWMHDARLEVYRKRDGQWGLMSIIWMPVEMKY